MLSFYIYNKRVGIKEAAEQCGSASHLKELIHSCKMSGGREYAVFTHGKTLTICY